MNDLWTPSGEQPAERAGLPALPIERGSGSAKPPVGRGALLGLLVAAALGGGAIGGAGVALVQTRYSGHATAPLTTNVVAEFANASTSGAIAGDEIVDVVRAARPAVVTVINIRAVRSSSTSGIELRPYGSGSGVIFDGRGYIATNAHVIDGNQGVEVVFVDGRRGTAQVIGSDPDFDIAILKVDGPLPAVASLADSSRLEPGMRVLAIGSPLGTEYQNTVTTGIVAGLNRIVTMPDSRFDRRTFQFVRQDMQLNAAPMIQTDAAINNGNSGGPLINLAGEVVGLNTLVVRSNGNGQASVEGLGFAVPSNVVHTLADEWIDGVARPLLGIDYESITPDVARERDLERAGGAIVLDMRAGSAAARAGLLKGDVITEVDGIPLDLDHALTELLWSYRAGDVIKVSVLRGGSTFDVEVPLGAFPGQAEAAP